MKKLIILLLLTSCIPVVYVQQHGYYPHCNEYWAPAHYTFVEGTTYWEPGHWVCR